MAKPKDRCGKAFDKPWPKGGWYVCTKPKGHKIGRRRSVGGRVYETGHAGPMI